MAGAGLEQMDLEPEGRRDVRGRGAVLLRIQAVASGKAWSVQEVEEEQGEKNLV